ncbi:MAG: DNA/RNA non-specific endonuclease [Candidatus Nealsonbacteria bacterium]|nr:DNA/RNA non-specific endonuclease [Candidatus Nealsonbacteria bacterium]
MMRFTLLLLLWPVAVLGAELKPVVLDPTYEHDKYVTQPRDLVKEFRAFTVSFDSADDDDGDEIADVWAIPHWVAYEIKPSDDPPTSGPDRPKWMTIPDLRASGIAPDNESYHFSNQWRADHPNSKFLGYDRGHLCQKLHAFRLGADADWNTHVTLNACPQRAKLNQGIWLDLEKKTAAWPDTSGKSVYIICGPIIYGQKPLNWLGQRENGEVMVAIPDAFFKIVVRGGKVLAFNYPQRGIGYKGSGEYNHVPYLTNVDAIEHFTGLDFLTELPNEEEVERETATELWE